MGASAEEQDGAAGSFSPSDSGAYTRSLEPPRPRRRSRRRLRQPTPPTTSSEEGVLPMPRDRGPFWPCLHVMRNHESWTVQRVGRAAVLEVRLQTPADDEPKGVIDRDVAAV